MSSETDIAVIGMSCRFPDADNVEEFWSNLISSKHSVRSIPKERWYMTGQSDLVGGYLKCPLDEFDANFFNISPKEATYIDPQHRLFLEVSWESLENAGIPPTSLNGSKTGVYLGIGSDEYFRTQLDATEDTIYKIVGNSISAATGRLSYILNLLGPSIPIEATCASSAVAVHLACVALRRGECTMALAGGVNVLLSSDSTYPSALISPSCRSFDASASGFAPAEGCGVVILKPLKDAIRDRNEVLGVIRGSSMNHTGKSTSFGTPRTFSEEQVIREALEVAAVDPLDISYVEAHVGGTVIGDPIEVKAISNVFGSRDRVFPLVLGAFKTNIGHPMAAAGVAGIIKMLLCFKHRTIPPNLHLSNLHPEIDVDGIPAILPSTPVRWTSSRGLFGGVNCFGITGTNVHIVLQEPPATTAKIQECSEASKVEMTLPLQLITFSAKDEFALETLREKYKMALDLSSDTSQALNNFAFSANTTRSHLTHRVALLGSTCVEMSTKLNTFEYLTGTVQSVHQPIVFLFTGHGCQYFGMAQDLYKSSAIFRKTFNECNAVYRNNLGIGLEAFIWDKETGIDINRTKYCQPAIYVIEYCLFKLWTELGVRPDFVLGHSIGEFAACVAAGLLSFEDGMKLVCCRSILIDELPVGKMLAIGASIDRVNELIQEFQTLDTGWVDVACNNSLDQTVVSTQPETAVKFKQFLDQKVPSVKSKVLPSLHGFHSRSMEPILDRFAAIAAEVTVGDPRCKYVSGALNRELEPHEMDENYWRNHCRNTVSFSNAIDLMLQKGCKVFLEVSPQPILLNFIMSNNVHGFEVVACPSLRSTHESWTTLQGSLAKLYVSTNLDIRFHQLYPTAQRIQLPNYAFNRKPCWATQRPKASKGPTQGPQFHSLLGWKLSLPMTSDLRFYNYLSSNSTGYVQDHVIVDHVLVPAACYVEMLLTLARKEFRVECPVIENFQVLRACVLDENLKHIQTKAEFEGANLSVLFFSEGEDGEWTQHVQATINFESPPSMAPPPLSQEEMEAIRSDCAEEIDVEAMYGRLDASGISMGPLFKSARKLCINRDKSSMLGSLKSIKSQSGEFSFHPIMIDALVQCFWEYKMCRLDDTPFALPVGINKFVWYGGDNATLPEDLYFHIRDEDHGVVYTAEGHIVVEIEVLTVLHSSKIAFLRSITPGDKLPQFISKDWVPLSKGTSDDIPSIPCLSLDNAAEALQLILSDLQAREPLEMAYEKLTYLYILKTLKKLGWSPTLGEFVKPEIIKNELLDSRSYANWLDILVLEGILEKCDGARWRLIKETPSIDDIIIEIVQLENDLSKSEPSDVAYIKQLASTLLPVLKGDLDPLESMMSSKMTQMTSKQECQRAQIDGKLLGTVFQKTLEPCAEAFRARKLRILQIGVSPNITRAVVEVLEKLNVLFQYTVSGSGPTLKVGSDLLPKSESKIDVRTLDIQKDPKCQGFQPGDYDIIISMQTLHVTENLPASLDNVRHLLAANGHFFLGELVENYRDFALSYALLPSYWKIQDSRGFVIPRADRWSELLTQSGFDEILSLNTPGCKRALFVSRASSNSSIYRPFSSALTINDPAWLIFGSDSNDLQRKIGQRLKDAGRNAFYVVEGPRFEKVNDLFEVNPKRASDFQQLCHVLKNYEIEGILYLWGMSAEQCTVGSTAELRKVQETITTGFLNTLKTRINNSWESKVFLVTAGAEELNPAQGTLWGMLETYFNEYPEATGIGIDLDLGTVSEEDAAKFVFSVIWDTPDERGLQFQNGVVETSRLHSYDSVPPLDEILLPKFDRFRLADPTTFTFEQGAVSDKNENLEVAVRAVGLNFRDVLLCYGLLETMNPDSVGLEFSGVVTNSGRSALAVGDRVAGLTCSGAFSSHLSILNPQLVFPIPSTVSFFGAATLPVAYGTCYLSLVEIAKLQSGQAVLIHTASGGVGLAGIQLARMLGADVFVTAGTHKKRKYLQECLGVTHVYSSRKHDYSEQILLDTSGCGVDVIINTITGPGFKEASLRCLAQHGRFIELSKLNVWQAEEVAALRPDVKYTILDAFDMILNTHPSLTGALNELTQLFSLRKLEILPHTCYPLAQLKSAFRFFHAHNHIGKVVIEIPETPDKLSALTLYNPNSTYMVTGGLGGLGFEVGRYLYENGGNVLLVGRSLPSEEMQSKIDAYPERMIYVQTDIGDFEQCRELLKGIEPPLRGIFHCAGVFANAFLVGQSTEFYAKSFQSKVYGTWNLHLLTSGHHLDHFVIFSSVAAVLGSTGLSNYSAANRYLDSLMHYRTNQCGLPGLTIDWGPWAEVGAAAGYVSGMFKNFHHFPPELGIRSMERAMRLRFTDIAIADMDLNIVQSSPRLGPYLSELKVEMGSGKRRGAKGDWGANRPCDIKVANLAKDVLAASDAQSRVDKMETFVEAIFKMQSGIGDSDVVDKDQALTLMGMDSLIGMEIRLRISKLLDVQIPINGIMDHNSIKLFSAYLAQLLPPLADTVIDTTPESGAVEVTVEPREEITTNGVSENSLQDKRHKPERHKSSLPKFVAKRLQKFNSSDKKHSKNEKLSNGISV